MLITGSSYPIGRCLNFGFNGALGLWIRRRLRPPREPPRHDDFRPTVLGTLHLPSRYVLKGHMTLLYSYDAKLSQASIQK